MSAVLTANRWAVALRGVGIAFAAVILAMPQPTLAALILLFTAYLAADGLLAGAVSAAWGAAANTAAWYYGGELEGTGFWLAAHAILFGATILVLARRLRSVATASASA
jgi:hypothetical protein